MYVWHAPERTQCCTSGICVLFFCPPRPSLLLSSEQRWSNQQDTAVTHTRTLVVVYCCAEVKVASAEILRAYVTTNCCKHSQPFLSRVCAQKRAAHPSSLAPNAGITTACIASSSILGVVADTRCRSVKKKPAKFRKGQPTQQRRRLAEGAGREAGHGVPNKTAQNT